MMLKFNVEGMTCGHCARAVTEALKKIDATAKVEVDLPSGVVQVDSTADRNRLAEAIREEGYVVAA